MHGLKTTELGPLPEDWEVMRFDKAVKNRGIKVGKVKQSEYRPKGNELILARIGSHSQLFRS